MDIIQLLPDHIANQIAAGEVIQRPSSVVKELVENSIDSGATEIQLYIQEAGKTLIHVIDNGCGMSYNDVEKCFERHATSKIKKTDDLFEISLIFKVVLNIIGLIYFFYKTKNFENLKLFIKKGQFI